jgi:hypothetical protein
MMQESVDALQAGRESSDRSPSALLAPRIPAPSEQLALCCLKCAVEDLLDVKCREMPEDQEGSEVRAHQSGSTRWQKEGGASRLLARNICNQRGGGQWWAGVPSEATVSTLDVTSSSKNSQAATLCTHQLCAKSKMKTCQDENLRGRGVPMSQTPIRVERYKPNQVGWNGDGWVYTSVPCVG